MASGSKKVIYAALAGNSLIAFSKFIAAAVTGSSAMASEGVHSLVDTGNQALLLYGIHRAKKPPSPQFPFGHGKEIYFWSFVVAILIFAVGAGISMYEGILHLLHPEPVESFVWNYVVLGLAMVFEGGSLFIAYHEFTRERGSVSTLKAVHRGKDPTLFVVLFEDSAAMLGLFVALAGVLLTQVTGNAVYDGLASIIIGCILGITAIWLAYETKSLLIGESADAETVALIHQIISKEKGINRIHEVLTLHMGPEYILATISVNAADGLRTGDLEKTFQRITDTIKKAAPHVKRVFIEVEDREVPNGPVPDRQSGSNPD